MTLPIIPEAEYLEPDESWDILQLTEAFKGLLQSRDLKNKLFIEKQKLHIVELVANKIQTKIPQYNVKQSITEENSYSALKKFFRWLFYYFLMVIGLIEDATGSFQFGKALFTLIPGITNPLLLAVSIIYTALQCILFYAFEVSLLRAALDITYVDTNLGLLINTYSKQLKEATRLISMIPVLISDNLMYEQHMEFIRLLQNDLKSKHNDINSYEESVWARVSKGVVLTFGALSSVTWSYFIASTFMTIWAASLIGTPAGIFIMLLTIVSGLGFYYAMGAKGVAQLINPDYDKFQALKEELGQFSDDFGNKLQIIRASKQELENSQSLAQLNNPDSDKSQALEEGDCQFSYNSENELKYDEICDNKSEVVSRSRYTLFAEDLPSVAESKTPSRYVCP